MTREQLKESGWVETKSGNWVKGKTVGDATQLKAVEFLADRFPGGVFSAETKASSSITHVSTDEAKLNKTERAFLAYLRANNYEHIGIQNITFKLADDCRYTPDFATWAGCFLTCYEVKGFMRDDARVKLKVAARLFPNVRFVLVRKDKDQWQMEDVKP